MRVQLCAAAMLVGKVACAQGAGAIPPVIVLPPAGVLAVVAPPPVVVAPDAGALFTSAVAAIPVPIRRARAVVRPRVAASPRVYAPSLLYAPPPYYAAPADLPRLPQGMPQGMPWPYQW